MAWRECLAVMTIGAVAGSCGQSPSIGTCSGTTLACPPQCHPACSPGVACGRGATCVPATTTELVLPYMAVAIEYEPPFNQSSVVSGQPGTLGSRARLQVTTSDGATVVASVEGTPSDWRDYFSTTPDELAVVDLSGTGEDRDDLPICDDPASAPCSLNDPSPLADTYFIVFGATVREEDVGDGHPSFTVDWSTATMHQLDVYELMLLAQDPPDYSQFLDLQVRALAQKYLTPGDAEQLLSLDPYLSGEVFGDHSERFEAGCSWKANCGTPAQLDVPAVAIGSTGASVAGPFDARASPSDGAEAAATQEIGLLGTAGGDPVATLSVAYQNVTAAAGFSQRSTSITFQNTSHCEEGRVDLWFDKAFGAFLWRTDLRNRCQ